jgi:hypothetical protein
MTEQPGPAAPSSLIPRSTALAEASPESLSELMSRDPESYQKQDIQRVIAALRAMREKWASAEGGPKAPKAPKITGPGLLQKSIKTAEELGF